MCIDGPGFFHIAPMATHVTTTQSDEIGGMSLVFTFSLQRVKRFHHWISKFGSFYGGFYIFGVGLHLDLH
jgi:hypothetical protein